MNVQGTKNDSRKNSVTLEHRLSNAYDRAVPRCKGIDKTVASLTVAAAVGLSLGVQHSEAAIQYSGNVVDGTFGAGDSLYVDFGLAFGTIAVFAGSAAESFGFFGPGRSFRGVGTTSSVSMLATSKFVGTQTKWAIGGAFYYQTGTVTNGPWDSADKIGYMGFRFDNSGTTNYGWMEIQRNGTAKDSGILLRWAYEDEGNDIRVGDTGQGGGSSVPEPSGLALLAVGAAGIYGLRRKRKHKKA